MKNLIFATLISILLSTPAMAKQDDYVILKFDGKEINRSEIDTIWGGLFPGDSVPSFDGMDNKIKKNVLLGIASEKLLFDEAKKQHIDKDKKIAAKLEDMKRKFIVRSFLDKKTKNIITEAEIKAEYDNFVRQNAKKEEVRARHVLVDSKEKAAKIRKEIMTGAKFADVAKKHSSDKGTAVKGGDLGYFIKELMVPEFANAAFALKKGEVSQPVKSPFGWHIIKVEDRRKVKTPSFTSVRAKIKKKLEEERLNDFVEGLVKKANIKYFDKNGKELDFSEETSKATK